MHEKDLKLMGLMSELPTEYELDYLVYSMSDSALDEEKIWNTEYLILVKRAIFQGFDNYVEKRYLDAGRRT